MMDMLFNGVGWTDGALALNRIAVGMFFMLSGYHKLFNAERRRAFANELKGLGVHAIGFNQWWVPTVEFAAGGAVRMANPDRDRSADVIHEECLPAAGKSARL